jgi:8-oxo-dGTP diphosphatase
LYMVLGHYKPQETPTAGAAAFIRQGERYLLVFDPKFKFWRVPGGRINIGERAEQTLEREMREELGVEVSVGRFLGYGEDQVTLYSLDGTHKMSRLVLYFECSIKKGTPKAVEKTEIQEMKWLTLDEIKKVKPLEPAMQQYFGLKD